jgi:transposase, IS30 family
MSYSHLIMSERYRLYQYRNKGNLTMTEIAAEMNRSESTISRELKRNSFDGAQYLPDSAQLKMRTRRQQFKQKFMSISAPTIEHLKRHLQKYHSPEQVSGRMKREAIEQVSHETIYQMIYANHQGLGSYRQYLRQGRPKRRRRDSVQYKQGIIARRVRIEERLAIADHKREIGHWENDTVIGANHAGVIVTHVDKASKFLLTGLAKNKSVQHINRATIGLFEKLQQLQNVVDSTNHRPRKFLNHRTSHEAF